VLPRHALWPAARGAKARLMVLKHDAPSHSLRLRRSL